MGEIHKDSLDGLNLDGAIKSWARVLAWFFHAWFVAYCGFI